MPEGERRFTDQWDAIDPFDPAYPHLWIKVEHLGRYLFARNFLQDRKAGRIADIGCGTGYGSRELATFASSVTAIDACQDQLDSIGSGDGVIETLRLELGVEPLKPRVDGAEWDAIVCFETLEHLTDPAKALTEFRDGLAPEGHLIISVPNSVAERTDPVGLLSNRFHQRVFTVSAISDLLIEAGFHIQHVLGQPLASEINRNETRLIRRKQTSGRIGDEPALHEAETIRRLALAVGYPEQRDVERSYSIIVVATPGRQQSAHSGPA